MIRCTLEYRGSVAQGQEMIGPFTTCKTLTDPVLDLCPPCLSLPPQESVTLSVRPYACERRAWQSRIAAPQFSKYNTQGVYCIAGRGTSENAGARTASNECICTLMDRSTSICHDMIGTIQIPVLPPNFGQASSSFSSYRKITERKTLYAQLAFTLPPKIDHAAILYVHACPDVSQVAILDIQDHWGDLQPIHARASYLFPCLFSTTWQHHFFSSQTALPCI